MVACASCCGGLVDTASQRLGGTPDIGREMLWALLILIQQSRMIGAVLAGLGADSRDWKEVEMMEQ